LNPGRSGETAKIYMLTKIRNVFLATTIPRIEDIKIHTRRCCLQNNIDYITTEECYVVNVKGRTNFWMQQVLIKDFWDCGNNCGQALTPILTLIQTCNPYPNSFCSIIPPFLFTERSRKVPKNKGE
jgi:hypothetical protein